MSIDIQILVCAVALTLVQMLVATTGATMQVGLSSLAGNRQDTPALTGWVGRAQRAHRNMLENIPLFGILVLAAVASGRADATTALGAQIFIWARLAYAVIYLAGFPWVRTAVWGVSIAGMLLILSQLF